MPKYSNYFGRKVRIEMKTKQISDKWLGFTEKCELGRGRYDNEDLTTLLFFSTRRADNQWTVFR